MKKVKLFFIVICSYFSLCFSQIYTISLVESESMKDTTNLLPKRIVIENQNSIIVSYQIGGVDVLGVERGNESYTLLKIGGFSYMDSVGKPQLPAYNDIIALPTTQNIEIQILNAEYKDFGDFHVVPAQEPESEWEQNSVFTKDSVAYSSDAFYPSKIADIISIQDYREVPIAFVQLRPVQYNPVSKKIRCYSKVTYQIKYDKPVLSKTIDSGTVERLKMLSANSLEVTPALEAKSSIANTDKNYIIVTTDKYLSAVEPFAAWKTRIGNKCEIISQSAWSSEEVESAVHSRYENWSPKPEYLLIVGDHEDVPGRIYSSSDGNYASDLPYACMGGSGDYTADMAFGRISVSSLDEANIVFEKIMQYEQHPVEDVAFYNTALHCAQFQDDGRDGYADRRFTHTCEEIRDYVLTQGKTVNRVYYADADVYPRYYNNGRYSDGQPISAELRKDISPFFPWDGNNQDILDEMNQGRLYVLHRDHGYYQGWSHPNFSTSDINNLTNGSKLPIVFSLNCQTGGFLQGECLAEKFLRHPDGGAVGVIAASQTSFSGYNDAIAAGLFDAMWPYPGLIPDFGGNRVSSVAEHDGIYPMGHVLNHGLLRMGQTWDAYDYQNRIFHYFGDPSMEMYTDTPQWFTAVSVKKEGANISVNTRLLDCKITISSAYDMGEAFFETVDATSHTFINVPEPYCLTITKHNYVPYVYFSDCYYLQNEMITTDRHIQANNIYVGNSVTTSKPQGDVVIKNGAHVIFDATGEVVFDKGFECEGGSTFEVIK